MQILTPPQAAERVGFVVPRWTTADPDHERQGTPFRCFPVAGALFNHGYEVVWADQEVDLDWEHRGEELLDALQDVAVLFFWNNELWPMTQLHNIGLITQHVRSRNPNVKTVVGGAFPTVCPDEMLHVDGVADFFLRGYGEDTVHLLMEALRGERSLQDVPGLVWRDGDGHHSNPIPLHTRFHEADNEVLYRRIDMAPFIQRGGIFGNGEGTLMVGTGRGCGKGCSFCYWRNTEPALLKPESIVDVVEHLRETFGVHQFHLAELDFFTNRHRAVNLARLWKERLGDCIWFALISPVDTRKFSSDDWRLMAEGGCRKLELGTESGSPTMLTALGKHHDADEVLALNRLLLDHGISTMHNFIFGFDGETADDRRASFRLIESLLRQDPVRVTFAVRLFQATPETPMGDAAIADHEFPETIDDLGSYRPAYSDGSARMMPWLPEGDERTIKKVIDYYLPLAISRLKCNNPFQRLLYSGLRRQAWRRLRSQRFGGDTDARLFQRFLGRRLSLTYRA